METNSNSYLKIKIENWKVRSEIMKGKKSIEINSN